MPTPVYDGLVYDDNTNQYESDKKLLVEFFMIAVKNEVKSNQAGRPIFDEKPCIKIIVPGSKDVTVTRATGPYLERFPRQWEAFRRGQETAVDGTPLEEVPFLTVSQIAELKAVNVRTLEQLADMSDVLAQKFMGNFNMRQRARNLVAAAKDAAPLLQMQAALEQRDTQIKELQDKLNIILNNQAKVPA